MNKSVTCGVLLKRRTGEQRRFRCTRPATHIRNIYGRRVALVVCDLHNGVENVDIADDGLVDLTDLPDNLRRVASGQLRKQLHELDVEIEGLQQQRAKLTEELDMLVNMDAANPTPLPVQEQQTRRLSEPK